ncbi:hypothetical protein ACFV08_04645 [Streptomyces fradiae]|uniref:hypothetical protein n=1 Tax=Streptomyces fradiae TaxID=1906 RepID=UPI0036B11D78
MATAQPAPGRGAAEGAPAGKAAQNAAVAAARPALALDLTVLEGPAELAAHLAAVRGTTVVRPDVSDDTGSALFHRPAAPLPAGATAHLWERPGARVVAHPEAAGVPHFANGVVHEGRLVLTDCWRCFTLDEGPRRLITSVINLAPSAPLLPRLTGELQPVVTASGAADGPVHFELVVGEDQTKVVKYARRQAGSPLPELCDLLGVPGQAGALATGRPVALADTGSPGFVADYSFLVRAHGRLEEITDLAGLVGRPSYAGTECAPRPGDLLSPSQDESAVLQLLLRHDEEATVLADIAHYQERNRAGVFVLAPR